jgi:hypothetical protein
LKKNITKVTGYEAGNKNSIYGMIIQNFTKTSRRALEKLQPHIQLLHGSIGDRKMVLKIHIYVYYIPGLFNDDITTLHEMTR